jgi:hypothetical protein
VATTKRTRKNSNDQIKKESSKKHNPQPINKQQAKTNRQFGNIGTNRYNAITNSLYYFYSPKQLRLPLCLLTILFYSPYVSSASASASAIYNLYLII